MSVSARPARALLKGPAPVIAGVLVAFLAGTLPVNLESVSPTLLAAAGRGTPSVAEFGLRLVQSEKIGPAALCLAAAHDLKDPREPELDRALEVSIAREPTFAAWGGWDPFLDPIFDLRSPTGHEASTPILTFFITENARNALGAYLVNSGSETVQALLKTRDVPSTGRFVPATRPGGQPLDAMILLTALLCQGERLSPSLRIELRGLAEAAVRRRDLGDLGDFYLDLLSLARRLDWAQLAELVGQTQGIRAVAEYAQLSRVAPDHFPIIYTAGLISGSADRVADYLMRFGAQGSKDLGLALANGQGAVKLLMAEQVPVNPSEGPALSDAAALVLLHPQLMLALKYLGYLAGIYLVLRGLDGWMISSAGGALGSGRARHIGAGLLSVLLAGLVIVATEPFLLRPAGASEYRLGPRLPMLELSGAPPPAQAASSFTTMNSSTLVSIGIFALLQVVMYTICVKKINQIAGDDIPPLLKLRLMENEENLFDSGLYVGMMGTAAALVLQVLGVIAPNLLAAYSSNLFGIVCVALVKIRHVRSFKRQLILENEAAVAGAA